MMFEDVDEQKQDVEASDVDRAWYTRLKNIFESCPAIRSDLPSISEMFQRHISDELVNGTSAPNLHELVERHGDRRDQSITSMFFKLCLSSAKGDITRRGSRQAAFSEEHKVVNRQMSRLAWSRIHRIMRD